MRPFLLGSVAVLSLVFCGGCGKSGPKATDPLPVEQMRAAFQKAFASADETTREAANKFVDDAEKHQIATAYAEINDLMTFHLTPDQNLTLVRAANTIGQLMADAAQNGDQQASEAMQTVMSRH